jgi:hypothetical protein
LSLFEAHSVVIRKGKAHKPNEFGRLVRIDEVETGFVSNYAVAPGNLCDQQQWVPALQDHMELYGQAAIWCGVNEDIFLGIASIVTYYFGPRQRQVLLGWLLDIEENMRWDPRRYWLALHPEEVERMLAQQREELDQQSHQD